MIFYHLDNMTFYHSDNMTFYFDLWQLYFIQEKTTFTILGLFSRSIYAALAERAASIWGLAFTFSRS